MGCVNPSILAGSAPGSPRPWIAGRTVTGYRRWRPGLLVCLGQGVDEASLAQDDSVLAAVPLCRRHEANAAMAVFLDMPVHETLYPGMGRAQV